MWSDCIAKFLSSTIGTADGNGWSRRAYILETRFNGLKFFSPNMACHFWNIPKRRNKKKNSSKPIETKHSSRFWENMFNHCEEVELKQQISSHLGTRGLATTRCKRCKLSLMIISSQGSQLTWMCSRWLEKIRRNKTYSVFRSKWILRCQKVNHQPFQ